MVLAVITTAKALKRKCGMFKIVNKYGKSVTVTMSMKEKTVFNSEVLANIVCKFLNTKETKPDWLVNNFDVVACKPYKVERV